jgi:Ca2+-binding RTX toxin-like protein
VTNKGRIEAAVMLNGGADVVDNRGGTIIGEIRGGAGDDTLIAGRASDKLTEVLNEGTDTVKASVSYQLGAFVERLVLTGKRDINGTGSDTATINHIHGNTGDNKLSGLGGIDELSGGKGRDTLTGGADIDVFELAKGSGRDVVTDYTDEQDLIAVNGFAGIADFNALLPKIAQKNGFVEINMGKGDTLILKGALAGDLEQGDFIFNYEIA